jgi:hypothetical protein
VYVVFHDRTGRSVPIEANLGLDAFPSPADLCGGRYRAWMICGICVRYPDRRWGISAQSPDMGRSYVISDDGVGKIEVYGPRLGDLFQTK